MGESTQIAPVAVGSTHRQHVDVTVDGIIHIHEVNVSLGIVDPHQLGSQLFALTIEAMNRNLNLLAQTHIGKANQGKSLQRRIPSYREVAFSKAHGRHLQKFFQVRYVAVGTYGAQQHVALVLSPRVGAVVHIAGSLDRDHTPKHYGETLVVFGDFFELPDLGHGLAVVAGKKVLGFAEKTARNAPVGGEARGVQGAHVVQLNFSVGVLPAPPKLIGLRISTLA